jgi:hypothetical protein
MGYTSRNDLPVVNVKKNPLQHLFSTQVGEEKQGYTSSENGGGKGAFNIDKGACHINPLRIYTFNLTVPLNQS